MKTKICSKCKIEKNISEFYKSKTKKNGPSWCKCCCKQYRKDNAENIAKQQKQYYKDNIEKIAKWGKQYRKNNAKKRAEQQKQYYKNNTEKIAQYRKNNAEKIAKREKQYRKNNAKKIAKYRQDNAKKLTEQQKQYRKDNTKKIAKRRQDNALFETFSKRLEMFEKIRHCPENNELLEVRCAYCGQWLTPTNQQVRSRLRAFNGVRSGENRFYCSKNCKQSCPTYGQRKYPKGFKQATSREVVPLLRQLVLERDNYTCQKCGATTETAQLHVHHEKSYTLNKIMANDPDNCITLCKECHKEVHQQDGCRYVDLKCGGK